MKAARLVVLGVALAAGGLAALLAGRSGNTPPPELVKPAAQLETTDILVAKSDIGAGMPVSAQDLEWKIWPTASAAPAFIRKTDQPNAIEELSKSYARAPFVAGEPIQESRLIKAGQAGYMAAILPSGMRAVSTEIKPETGAGGFIIPGDHVDVILYRRDKEAERGSGGVEAHVSETILRNVRVLAIDQTVEDKNGQKVVIGKTATLELSPGQAETLVLAQQIGVVSLALRSVADTRKSAGEDATTSRNEINMIRYGNAITRMTK